MFEMAELLASMIAEVRLKTRTLAVLLFYKDIRDINNLFLTNRFSGSMLGSLSPLSAVSTPKRQQLKEKKRQLLAALLPSRTVAMHRRPEGG